MLIYLAIVVVMGLVTFVAFWLDKRRAVRGDRRISERALHAMELAGGWVGAIAAMFVIRHKNRKPAYWAVTGVIALAHMTVIWIAYA
ncbi:MAG: DUF1294 domain-containing protein [Phycisphaerales bacterium]